MKITLHQEMLELIRTASSPLSSSDIAAEVNKRNLYRRKDNKPVPAGQIRARANNYSKLFELDGPLISLKKKVL